MSPSLFSRYTPLDYAEFHGHSACVDILSKAGGVRTGTIREMAATSIQAAYRGYRCVSSIPPSLLIKETSNGDMLLFQAMECMKTNCGV